MTSIDEALESIRRQQAVMVDFRFCDLLGEWRHISVPADLIDAKTFENGLGFDGSSIDGWQGIERSDMALRPDPNTLVEDPYRRHKTVAFTCDISHPQEQRPYARDPRAIARRAVEFVRELGIADHVSCGPEPEFSIFDEIRAQVDSHASSFRVRSHEELNQPGGDGPALLDHKIAAKQGYLKQAPADSLVDLRADIALGLRQSGVFSEASHHEVGAAGQSEIPIRFASLLDSADQIMAFKYVVKNEAKRHNKIATFMPKPIFGDNGNGMHVHQSLWKQGKPLFAGDQYAGLSQMALWYIGGILKHARALCAFANPTVNSYRRLVDGFEAPVYLCFGAGNRSAAVRIPQQSDNPKARRLEIRFGDPSANPYLMFSAYLLAGLDGIRQKIEPPAAVDQDIFSLPSEKRSSFQQTPRDLQDALYALHEDHDFLVEGGIFERELIEMWIDLKQRSEVDILRQYPTPLEYQMYANC